jgi:hypothetical protein
MSAIFVNFNPGGLAVKKSCLFLFLSACTLFLLSSDASNKNGAGLSSTLQSPATEEQAQEKVKRFLVGFIGGAPSWKNSSQGLDELLLQFESFKNRLNHAEARFRTAYQDRKAAKQRYKLRYSRQAQQSIKAAKESMKARIASHLNQALPVLIAPYKQQIAQAEQEKSTLSRMLEHRDEKLKNLTLQCLPHSPELDKPLQPSPVRLSTFKTTSPVEDTARLFATPPPGYFDERDEEGFPDSPDSFGSAASEGRQGSPAFQPVGRGDSPHVLQQQHSRPVHWTWAFMITRMQAEIARRDAELRLIRLELKNTQDQSSAIFREIQNWFVQKENELQDLRGELQQVTAELEQERALAQRFGQEAEQLRTQLGQTGRGVFSSVLSSINGFWR